MIARTHIFRSSWAIRLMLASLVLMLAACAGPAAEPTKVSTAAKPTAAGVTEKAAPSPSQGGPGASSPAASPAALATQPQKEAVKPLSPPIKVKMGYLGITGDAGLFVALEKGYFKDEGIDIDLVLFRSAGETIPPLATGELDFGTGSVNPGYFNAIARGMDLRIVAEKVTYGRGLSGSGIVVRKDLFDSGALKEVSQLKGKTLAVNLRSNTMEMYADLALKKAGLSLDDVNVVAMGFPDMIAALGNKSVDAATEVEPFLAIGNDKGISTQLIELNEIYPSHLGAAIVVSPVFAQKNPEAVQRVVTAHLRGQRDYYDSFVKGKGDKTAFFNILMKYTDMKDLAMYQKMTYNSVNPDGLVDVNMLVNDQDYFFQKGWIDQKVDVKKILDTQYIDYALKRLGKYE